MWCDLSRLGSCHAARKIAEEIDGGHPVLSKTLRGCLRGAGHNRVAGAGQQVRELLAVPHYRIDEHRLAPAFREAALVGGAPGRTFGGVTITGRWATACSGLSSILSSTLVTVAYPPRYDRVAGVSGFRWPAEADCEIEHNAAVAAARCAIARCTAAREPSD